MSESDFEVNLRKLRREKLDQIVALGQAAYPNSYTFTHTIPQLRAFDTPANTAEALAAQHIEASIAGRLMAIRVQGKAGFAQLQQGGERLQIYVRKDDVGEPLFALYKLLDLGDHIGVRGFLMRTRTGELTLHAHEIAGSPDSGSPASAQPQRGGLHVGEPHLGGAASGEPHLSGTVSGEPQRGGPALTFLTKAMLALPDKYHGLEDTELRYRQRYVDLFMNTGHTAKSADQPAVPANPAAVTPGTPAVNASDTAGRLSIPSEASATPPTPPAVILSEAKDPEGARPATTSPVLSSEDLGAPPSPTVSSSAKVGSAEAVTIEDEPLNVRQVFVKRAAILRAIRKFFDERGYLEVETPMLHTIAGGAAARPFTTHHNALDIPLSLRIAPELHLKRLVVGGLDRVYEINRNFRNEGVSTKHNPEFTMLEFYQAYANYHDLMDLTQELITFVAMEVNGTMVCNFNGNKIDLGNWTKLSMREAIVKFWPSALLIPLEQSDFATEKALYSKLLFALDGGYDPATEDAFDPTWKPASTEDIEFVRVTKLLNGAFQNLKNRLAPLGKVIAEIFEAVAEAHLIQPTIIYDFPLAVSPLSKQKPDDPDWVERFEFYIGGFEVGNAFSELNDPDEQRARFEAQLAERDRGDDEAHQMDEDYVRALGYGLPPTAGEGIGIDRLTMILTGAKSIRDVILFPLMRPPKNADQND